MHALRLQIYTTVMQFAVHHQTSEHSHTLLCFWTTWKNVIGLNAFSDPRESTHCSDLFSPLIKGCGYTATLINKYIKKKKATRTYNKSCFSTFVLTISIFCCTSEFVVEKCKGIKALSGSHRRQMSVSKFSSLM